MLGQIKIREKLEKRQKLDELKVINSVKLLLEQNEKGRQLIKKELRSGGSCCENDFIFDKLETNRIFHLSHIKELCVQYRLRFLDAAHFNQLIPEEAITEIDHLNRLHNTTLSGFKIMAPSKAFRLKIYDDPLLFAPIGNQYYYLVHQWGNDMSYFRKWLVYPFRNLLTFTICSVVLSVFLTALIPSNVLSETIPLASVIVFLFLFKSVFAVGLYAFYMSGRKFNDTIWDSIFLK